MRWCGNGWASRSAESGAVEQGYLDSFVNREVELGWLAR